MVPKHKVVVASCMMLCLAYLLDAFQCCGVLYYVLLYQRRLQQQLAVQAVNEHNAALNSLRHIRRRIVRHHRRFWRIPGRTEQWWMNIFNEVLPMSEWKQI